MTELNHLVTARKSYRRRRDVTKLHEAAATGNIDQLKKLKSTHQNLAELEGMAALEVAVWGRHFGAAKLLIDAGCQPSEETLGHATEDKDEAMIALLRPSKGARCGRGPGADHRN